MSTDRRGAQGPPDIGSMVGRTVLRELRREAMAVRELAARGPALGDHAPCSPRDRSIEVRSRHEEADEMATTKEIGDRNVAAWEARDVEAFAALYADDAEFEGPGFPPVRGPEGARMLIETWCGAFPDNEITIHAEHVTGDTIVYECTFAGTHTADLPTPGGVIPATNRRMVGRFAEVFTIRDGLIHSDRIYYDQVELLVQLGLMPDPAEAAHA